jgi:hypothetical protein
VCVFFQFVTKILRFFKCDKLTKGVDDSNLKVRVYVSMNGVDFLAGQSPRVQFTYILENVVDAVYPSVTFDSGGEFLSVMGVNIGQYVNYCVFGGSPDPNPVEEDRVAIVPILQYVSLRREVICEAPRWLMSEDLSQERVWVRLTRFSATDALNSYAIHNLRPTA